jgi:hypothetical protein
MNKLSFVKSSPQSILADGDDVSNLRFIMKQFQNEEEEQDTDCEARDKIVIQA